MDGSISLGIAKDSTPMMTTSPIEIPSTNSNETSTHAISTNGNGVQHESTVSQSLGAPSNNQSEKPLLSHNHLKENSTSSLPKFNLKESFNSTGSIPGFLNLLFPGRDNQQNASMPSDSSQSASTSFASMTNNGKEESNQIPNPNSVHQNNSNSIVAQNGHQVVPASQLDGTQRQLIPSEDPNKQMYVDITEYLNMPQTAAAKKLGIPTSTLSKRWKEAVVARKWPYRTVSKIDKEIMTLLHNIPQGPDAPPLPPEIEHSLAILLRKRQEELRTVIIRV